MSTRGAACPILVLAGIGLLNVSPIVDPDLWWLLRSGRYILETRTLPTADPFSTAAGAEWINHAWGFELVLYGVHRVAGTTGLILMQALFAVATFGLLYALLRRERLGRGWSLLLVSLGALATRGFWAPRPQVVTYLFLAVFWAILREYRDGRSDRLPWLVPMTLAWVNLHGGFAVGPALIGLCFVTGLLERAFRGDEVAPEGRHLIRLGLVGAACGVVTLANPFHYRAALFPFQVMGERVAQNMITEWASLPFNQPQVLLLEGLIFAALVLLWYAPRVAPLSDIAVFAVFVHLALQAIRNTPLLVILLIPILGRLLAESATDDASPLAALPSLVRRYRGATAALAVVILVTVGWMMPARTLEEFVPRFGLAAGTFPVGAVEFLGREPRGGVLFNDYYWGGYLIWRLYPRYRVSIDGRAAVYGPGRLMEHSVIDEVRPGWRQALDRSGADFVLIRARSTLATALRAQPDWEGLYEDQVAVVFARRRGIP